MTNKHKLNLKMESNPEYYSIIEDHNLLMTDWNRLNLEIFKTKQPKLFLLCHKKNLLRIGQEIYSLQNKFLIWNSKASDFLNNPHLIFHEDEESEIGFHHFTATLRDIKNTLDNRMVMIATNFNKLQDIHSNQVNFIIATVSFVLTFIALIITLLTFNPDIKQSSIDDIKIDKPANQTVQ